MEQKKKFLEYWHIFANGIMAGVFIGIAGTVYLAMPIPALGAFLFGFGLLTILCNNFKLFTGAVGYLASQGRNTFAYLFTLLLIWGGNLVGCFAVGSAVRMSRVAEMSGIVAKAVNLCTIKSADSLTSLLILAFFCGILMYLAVDTFKRDLPPVIRMTNVFLFVMVFIISGFEHCIANMYYYSVAGMWSWGNLGVILWMTLGNALGGMFPVVADKIRN